MEADSSRETRWRERERCCPRARSDASLVRDNFGVINLFGRGKWRFKLHVVHYRLVNGLFLVTRHFGA